MKVYIMQGLPGSGKSTWIEKNRNEHDLVVSADHYHMIDGKYQWMAENAGKAHADCLAKFVVALLEKNHRYLFVDNTNTTGVELAPYVRLCEAFGVDYEITYAPCSVENSALRNTHGVPLHTIKNMSENILRSEWPQQWKRNILG